MTMQKLVVSTLTMLAMSFSSMAGAQTQNAAEATPLPSTLKEAAQAAVLKNPEVQSRWHAFREADEEIDFARGGFFPKIDLSAGVGHTKTRQKHRSVPIDIDNSYSGNESTISLRQMLFDGFATSNEVKRLGKAKLVRYFELLDASENVALEAARSYLDVVRYREQVTLAEDNNVQH
jgi:adhesin transport system outer membrane protein